MADEILLKNIKLVRDQIEAARKRMLAESSNGTTKSATDKSADDELLTEARSLAKAAFTLGPGGRACPECGGSGRA